MARAIVGVVLGILAALAAIACFERIDYFLFPPPLWLEASNREAIRAYTEGLPLGARLLAASGWFAGALAGGAVAFPVARRGWAIWTIAALDAAASLADVATFPPPFRVAARPGLARVSRPRDSGKGENGDRA